MIVRSLKDVENSGRLARGVGFDSYRYLLSSDGLGFSLHKTVIPKGDSLIWHYKNHLEACYCVEGRAELICTDTGESFEIKPDTLYALNNNDKHTFRAIEDTVLISVFNPPVTGLEVHDENGSYKI